jgi:hypothetical protein
MPSRVMPPSLAGHAAVAEPGSTPGNVIEESAPPPLLPAPLPLLVVPPLLPPLPLLPPPLLLRPPSGVSMVLRSPEQPATIHRRQMKPRGSSS